MIQGLSYLTRGYREGSAAPYLEEAHKVSVKAIDVSLPTSSRLHPAAQSDSMKRLTAEKVGLAMPRAKDGEAHPMLLLPEAAFGGLSPEGKRHRTSIKGVQAPEGEKLFM